MQEHIITIYCLCDDFLRVWGHADDPQAQMSDAEVMTVALVAAAFFVGNQRLSAVFLREHGYMTRVLSPGRLNRRLHAIPEATWQALFALLGRVHRQDNAGQEYAADSLPVPACDNIRIRRSRLYPLRATGGAFRGYVASKRRFFYGLRVHLLITAGGQPVEMALAPGAEADIAAFRQMTLDLPEGARVFADAAYLDGGYAQAAGEAAGVALVAQRRGNSLDPLPPWVAYLCDRTRKRIETTFSQIAAGFARSIHAVTARGFELKVFLTVLAYAITA